MGGIKGNIKKSTQKRREGKKSNRKKNMGKWRKRVDRLKVFSNNASFTVGKNGHYFFNKRGERRRDLEHNDNKHSLL